MDISVGTLYPSSGASRLKMIADDADCGDWEAASRRRILIGDAVDVDVGEVAEEDEDVDGVGEDPDPSPCSDVSGTPHCWCALFMTLLLSSRNINESWSRYPGHGLPTRMHCAH